MKKHHVFMSTFLLVLLAGLLTPQFAQESPSARANAEKARRHLAVDLLRAINTAEVSHKLQKGSFLPWQSLLADEPGYFGPFLARYPQPKANSHFENPPNILPGWNLRLNIHSDGQGYDVLLSDTSDEKCGYAALTDESGIIRQSKAIDCEI